MLLRHSNTAPFEHTYAHASRASYWTRPRPWGSRASRRRATVVARARAVAAVALPCVCVDSTHGKGSILAGSPALTKMVLEGEPVMRRLYDFNRAPGAMGVLVQALRQQFPESATPLGLGEAMTRGPSRRVGECVVPRADPPKDVFV